MLKVTQAIKKLVAQREAVQEAIYALSRLGPRHRGRPFGSGKKLLPRRKKR